MSEVVVVTRTVTQDSYGRDITIYSSDVNRNSYRVEREMGYKYPDDDFSQEPEKVDVWNVTRVSPIGQGWHVDGFYDQQDADAVATVLASKRSSK